MADAAVTFLLENLTELLRYNVDMISEAEDELQLLMKEVALMKDFLVDAAIKPKKEETFREWERQIREVVYDAEDNIDTCLTDAAMAKRPPKRKLNKHLGRGSMAAKIKSLREDKVKPMFHQAKRDCVNVQSGDGSGARLEEPSTRVKKVQFIREDNIVGFEDEEKTIITLLMEETKELDVISIIGMPGLGKTTLAWKIFRNSDIQHEFPICIWVYVSQDFNIRDVLLKILKGFTSQDMSGMSDQNLAMEVHKCLENGKFLLVLDDVWTTDAWNAIKHVLTMSNNMGKVLITSRYWKVGTHANAARRPHGLRFLNPKESWKLLHLEAFGNVENFPKGLDLFWQDIAEQCYGLPLAIVVTVRIHQDEISGPRRMTAFQDAWALTHSWITERLVQHRACENVHMHVANPRVESLSDIVALNYNKLPHDLKDCFLYLGVFPREYNIPVWTLTRLWIAEGLVQPKAGQRLEETADENLKDLINRKLVMVVTAYPTGQVKTCRVHDVIYKFCNFKAGIAEENLFQEIKFEKRVFEPSVADIYKYRRLCIHSGLSEYLWEFFLGKLKDKPVRSFLCFCQETVVLKPKYISPVFDAFKLLRVLHSKSIKFTHFPRNLTKLFHLRYITLSCADLSVLPGAITELWNLQTLVVDTMSRTLEIRGNIWNMIRLRHLKTKAAILLAMQGKGKGGESLQTLGRLSPEYCTPDVFKRVANLKFLGFRGNLAILLEHNRSLVNLECLETLKLRHDLFYQLASENPLPSLPPANCFPPNIKRLTLSSAFLNWKHMSTLAKIGTLEVLKLKDRAFMGGSWKAVDASFPRLQFLLIGKTDLVIWEASKDYFPSLGYLVLKNCENLSNIPLDLAKSLRMLSIEHVPKGTVESASKIKELKEQREAIEDEFELVIGPGCEGSPN